MPEIAMPITSALSALSHRPRRVVTARKRNANQRAASDATTAMMIESTTMLVLYPSVVPGHYIDAIPT